MQSATSMETGPSPRACTEKDPLNFSALDSAAASARASPSSAFTGVLCSWRESSVAASGPSRTTRPRTGLLGR